jgi:hypothetical protein
LVRNEARRHNSLIQKDLTGDLGFEPRLSDPESLVLPLHQSPRVERK